MFDLNRSYFNDIKERPLAASATLTEEGQCLVYVSDGAGGMAVAPSAGLAPGTAEIFAGFAITDALKVLTNTVVETVVVPSVAPYTVQLRNANVILASAFVINVTGGGTTMAAACPAPAATQYCVTTAGLMTFNVAQAGITATIVYRYNLTAAQTLEIFHARSVNSFAQDYFSSVSVGCLEGEIFTTMYDTSQANYAIGDIIYTGVGGNVTKVNTSSVVVGICSQVPGVISANGFTSSYLGVKYKSAA